MTTDELIAKKLSVLAHPARLAIIRMLMRAGPAGLPAGKLGESLGVAANALTFHLQKLDHGGLVTSRRQGQFNVYSAVFSELLELVDDLVGACCADSSQKCGPKCPSTGFRDSDVGPNGNVDSDDLANKEKRSPE